MDKQETCESCHQRFERPPGKRMHKCHDCRLLGLMANTAQVSAKQGPWWEKMVMGQYKRWKAEMEKLGYDT